MDDQYELKPAIQAILGAVQTMYLVRVKQFSTVVAIQAIIHTPLKNA